ncbi:MAG: citrate synthase [Thalassobaculum sp.]|uniref:citrate synthase n=1 Tax=Thalassobaculum sp. TaxID=2022740 RepID=UPI0032EE5D87
MSVTMDDAVAAETVLSRVDGEGGRLVVRGLDLEDLVAGHGFEATAALLWGAVDPGLGDPAAVATRLGAARARAFGRVPAILAATDGLAPIDVLRAGVAALSADGDRAAVLLATAAMPVLLAATARRGRGLAPVAPDPALGQVADLLRMLDGAPADPARVRALEVYLVTVADHGMNASTFAARVIAATASDPLSAVAGAIGALKGPLHGGAPGPVLDMLDAVGDPADADAWIAAALARGERLMGFGHRIYRARDPRADVLKAALADLGPRDPARAALAEAVERAARTALAARYPGRRLDTNVEFYTALLLEAVGIDRTLFTPAFAVGRVLGWTAHVLEQRATGRLIRPKSHYVGPLPEGDDYRAAANG